MDLQCKGSSLHQPYQLELAAVALRPDKLELAAVAMWPVPLLAAFLLLWSAPQLAHSSPGLSGLHLHMDGTVHLATAPGERKAAAVPMRSSMDRRPGAARCPSAQGSELI